MPDISYCVKEYYSFSSHPNDLLFGVKCKSGGFHRSWGLGRIRRLLTQLSRVRTCGEEYKDSYFVPVFHASCLYHEKGKTFANFEIKRDIVRDHEASSRSG